MSGNADIAKAKEVNASMIFTEVIRLDPKNELRQSELGFWNRGMEYGVKGDNDRAIADFNEALRLNPGDFRVFLSRGNIYMETGDYNRALSDYNQSIAMHANNEAQAIKAFPEQYAEAFCSRVEAGLRKAAGDRRRLTNYLHGAAGRKLFWPLGQIGDAANANGTGGRR